MSRWNAVTQKLPPARRTRPNDPACTERRWTPLGRRLGITRHAVQRRALLVAMQGMSWQRPTQYKEILDDPIVQAVAGTVLHGRIDVARLVGQRDLGDGRRLIGLQDAAGTRHYLLAQPTPGTDRWLSEVIHVLTEYPRPTHLHTAA